MPDIHKPSAHGKPQFLDLHGQRHQERIGTTVNVVIYLNSVPNAVGRIRNISLEGLFIEVTGTVLDIGMQVEIEFNIPEDINPTHLRLSGTVIHSRPDGVGIRLDAGRVQTVRA